MCKSVSDTYDPYLDVALEIRVWTLSCCFICIRTGRPEGKDPKEQKPMRACDPGRSGKKYLESYIFVYFFLAISLCELYFFQKEGGK